MRPPPIIGVAGYKKAGKTTLVERIVSDLAGRGLKVATVKHAHHEFEIDRPGRDSYRHRMAGASEVAVVSSARWAVVCELRGAPEPTLGEIVAKLSPADVVVVEGFKGEDFPKIEVRRTALGHPKLAGTVPGVVAVATDGPGEPGLPRFDPDDVVAIADFVVVHLGLAVRS